jgi:hypothetical protein
MLMAKVVLALLVVFAVALVVRLVLRVRRFNRQYDEAEGVAAERFRRRLEPPPSLPSDSENPPSQ